MGKNENVDVSKMQSEAASDPNTAIMAAQIQASENPGNQPVLVSPPNPAGNSYAFPVPYVQPEPNNNAASSSGGVMNFIKQNPIPVALGGGLLAFGIYQMVKPKSKSKGLSGFKTKTRSAGKKHKSAKAKRKGKQSIKTVKLF